ncbi:hypothetical protein [Neorhizobium sp. NCHU2750]|uniref:DUF6894 family protein n=1 Tax=Neorhizobium sp. NCHU2750 TaxID=1825976 RepID=UPI0013C5051D
MPRYYFHVRLAGKRYDDLEGSEMRDDETALAEARISARELSADRLRRGITTDEAAFEVEDADGTVIGTIPFPRTMA